MHWLIVSFISVCLTITTAFAGEPHKKSADQMDPQAMMDLYQKLAAPGEPHRQLAGLVGSWTTQTKEWMEPGKPPMESTGSSVFTILLEGRFLQQKYQGAMMGQPYSGIGITAYDNLGKRYVSTWMDSMSTGIFLMEGTASPDGKTITLHGQHDEPGGGTMTHRAIWKIVDHNTQTFEMYGAHDGGQETKMLEITYSRNP